MTVAKRTSFSQVLTNEIAILSTLFGKNILVINESDYPRGFLSFKMPRPPGKKNSKRKSNFGNTDAKRQRIRR